MDINYILTSIVSIVFSILSNRILKNSKTAFKNFVYAFLVTVILLKLVLVCSPQTGDYSLSTSDKRLLLIMLLEFFGFFSFTSLVYNYLHDRLFNSEPFYCRSFFMYLDNKISMKLQNKVNRVKVGDKDELEKRIIKNSHSILATSPIHDFKNEVFKVIIAEEKEKIKRLWLNCMGVVFLFMLIIALIVNFFNDTPQYNYFKSDTIVKIENLSFTVPQNTKFDLLFSEKHNKRSKAIVKYVFPNTFTIKKGTKLRLKKRSILVPLKYRRVNVSYGDRQTSNKSEIYSNSSTGIELQKDIDATVIEDKGALVEIGKSDNFEEEINIGTMVTYGIALILISIFLSTNYMFMSYYLKFRTKDILSSYYKIDI